MININPPTFLWPKGKAFVTFFVWIKTKPAQISINFFAPLFPQKI